MDKEFRKRNDGYYQIQIDCGYDEFGKRKRKTIYGKTPHELERKVIDFKIQLQSGKVSNKKPLTFEQMANLWFEKHSGSRSQATIKRYKSVMKNQLSLLLPMKLNKISTVTIQELLNRLQQQGCKSNIKLTKSVLLEIFKKAVSYGYVATNPVINVETPKYEKTKRRALTDIELQAINNTTEFTPKEKAYLYIGLYAGLRQGEILALSLKDINLTERYISVNKTLTYPSNSAVLQNHTKTKSGMREVRIGEPLITVLKEYIDTIPNYQFLFQRKDGSLFSKTAKANLWYQIKKKINKHMPKGCETNITSHFLRHNYATDLCNTNLPVKHIQYLLGHANIQTTLNIYAETRKEEIDMSSVEDYWKSKAIC